MHVCGPAHQEWTWCNYKCKDLPGGTLRNFKSQDFNIQVDSSTRYVMNSTRKLTSAQDVQYFCWLRFIYIENVHAILSNSKPPAYSGAIVLQCWFDHQVMPDWFEELRELGVSCWQDTRSESAEDSLLAKKNFQLWYLGQELNSRLIVSLQNFINSFERYNS